MAKIEPRFRGAFAQGYTPETVNAVLGPISWANGTRLLVLWDRIDEYGPGGDSNVYALGPDERLHEVDPELFEFLLDPQGPGGEGLVLASLWSRTPAVRSIARTIEIDGHNLARMDLRS